MMTESGTKSAALAVAGMNISGVGTSVEQRIEFIPSSNCLSKFDLVRLQV